MFRFEVSAIGRSGFCPRAEDEGECKEGRQPTEECLDVA